MAFPRIGGPGVGLNLTGALGSQLPGAGNLPAGSFPSTGPVPTNALTLPAGATQMVPAGTYYVMTGSVTSLQFLDPVSTMWRTINAEADFKPHVIESDGGNFRLANLTGTPVGALITNIGATYTNGIGTAVTGLTITPSAGGSVWQPVVGGAINTTITITTAGTGYTFPPTLIVQAPPAGGIQASAICTVSAGAINAVTVINQGAGYVTAPIVSVINDFRDTTGSGGVLTVNATLVGSAGLTAMYPTSQGTALTAVPTFTFSPASTTAATAVMNFVVTGFTVTAGGVVAGVSQPFGFISIGGIVAGTAAANIAGPISNIGLTQPRAAMISGTTTAGGAIQTAGSVVVDPGFGFQAIPSLGWLNGGSGLPTTTPIGAATVGGISDTSYLQPI